jgi:aldehyde:ferredoxin oxidoreductase
VGEYFVNPRVPAVKRHSVAAYDPRALQGQGVTFATMPMGADHTAGNMVGLYLEKKLDSLTIEGQVEISIIMEGKVVEREDKISPNVTVNIFPVLHGG